MEVGPFKEPTLTGVSGVSGDFCASEAFCAWEAFCASEASFVYGVSDGAAEQPIKEAAKAKAKAADLNFFMIITSFIPVSIQENQENINCETGGSSLFR